MALLQVRNFPDDVYEALKALAKRERRSVSQQVIVLLKNVLEEQEERKIQRLELLERLLEEPPISTTGFPSPADLIREDRER